MPTASTDRRRKLGQRLFVAMAAVSVGLLLAAGMLEAVFSYREARQHMAGLQAVQTSAAAAEIEQYLIALDRGAQQVQALPWGQPGFDLAQRRDELRRLLALQPALVEAVDVDALGREVLAVSRSAPDRVASGLPTLSTLPPPGWQRPFFDATGSPQVQRVLQGVATGAARTLILVNLRFLGGVASGLRVPGGGEMYVVDGDDRLIAHADATRALRQMSLREHPVVQAARRNALAGTPRLDAMDAPGLQGADAVTSAVVLPGTDWLLFIEQPLELAMLPAAATLQRTLLLAALAGLIAMLASAALAHHIATPIAGLRAATTDMANGRWDRRLELHTGDEIEGLAEDFNIMATRLRQSYSELELKVIERTAELAQRRDEAERANGAKTRFLASASHDLRQPMHAIGLLVGLLRERLAEGEPRSLADKTYDAVQVMERMFGGLLDISRLDAGAVHPQVQAFSMQDLLARIEQAYAPLAAAKGLHLRVRSGALRVNTDPALLERIIGNLVTNAIRYTASGGVLVACRPYAGGARLLVIDTGIGIAPPAQAAVFEEFVRLGGSNDQGLGLGLAIVQRTATLLGAEVQLRSQPGRGSAFELRLPLRMLCVPPPPDEVVATGPLGQVAGAFVLVADDDERNRGATVALLEHWGCLVAAAADAAAALTEAKRHLRAPDAVLTDLRLGNGADGAGLIRQLRSFFDSKLPALVVTADLQLPQPTDPSIQVLHKPVGSARLLQALSLALAERPDSD